MKMKKEILPINNSLLNKVKYLCVFNNLKFEFKNGYIFKIKDTNLNCLEPHRFIIKIENLNIILLCYDNLNLSLYKKDNIISFIELRNIINVIKRNKDES